MKKTIKKNYKRTKNDFKNAFKVKVFEKIRNEY